MGVGSGGGWGNGSREGVREHASSGHKAEPIAKHFPLANKNSLCAIFGLGYCFVIELWSDAPYVFKFIIASWAHLLKTKNIVYFPPVESLSLNFELTPLYKLDFVSISRLRKLDF